jgi:alpha-glucosidase
MRGPLEWAAAANMQRHIHDSNLEENRALLDIVRRRVDVFEGRFVFGEFSEEFERSGAYLPSDMGLHAGYNFAFLLANDAAAIHAHLQTLARFPDHWPCVSFSNHDVIRTATRFGQGMTKSLLALLCALRGTVLLYQGEELGLPEVDLRRDQLKDPVGDLYYPLFKGRDGCRTPMPWDASRPNLGFTTGVPWLPMGPAHAALAVSRQEGDPDSALAYTRKWLAARKIHPALREGTLDLLAGEGLAFVREAQDERIVCVFNLTGGGIRFDLPGPARALDLGWGETRQAGDALALGPGGVWVGTL